jgi:hypothetical protein
MHRLAHHTGLIDAIDRRVEVLSRHLTHQVPGDARLRRYLAGGLFEIRQAVVGLVQQHGAPTTGHRAPIPLF